MSRPPKDGVEYFPLDANFLQDDKIRLLKVEFGTQGIAILIAILCEIYRENGYFKMWDKDFCFLMADAVGCGVVPENIEQVTLGCLRRSIFDDRVFQMFSVLTSAGIQRRFLRAVATRDEIRMFQEYWLLDPSKRKDVPASVLRKLRLESVNSKETPESLKETPVNFKVTPQSKGKESKGEKRKENIKKSADAPGEVFKNYASGDAELLAALNDFAEMRKQMKKPLTERAARILLRTLEELKKQGFSPVPVLEQSIFSNWQGVFPLREGEINGTAAKPSVPAGKQSTKYGTVL